jgi:6-phosphogluconolactonase
MTSHLPILPRFLSRHGLGLVALAMTGIAVLAVLAGEPAAQAAPPSDITVFIGTHGGKGPGEGIFSARLDLTTGHLSHLKLAAAVERPTWLMPDPKRPVLYAVSETGNDGKAQGGVYSFAVEPKTATLKLINRVESGGGGATHLTYDRRLNTVFVGNFGGGQVSAFPVKPNGALSPLSSMQTDFGHGPHPRQTMAHAHGVTVDPSGRFLLSADMGADRVFVYRFDAATKTLSPATKPFEQMPAGSGPRHLVFSPDGRFAFLDTELSAQIFSFRWDARAGRLTLIQSQPIDKPAFKGEKSAAEIAVSRDGRFVYVSNRGENSLQVYAVDQKSGRLTQLQDIPGGGAIPWSFGIDPSGRWMIVANEPTSSIAVFRIDPVTGKLSPTGQTQSVFKPVAIAFYPP